MTSYARIYLVGCVLTASIRNHMTDDPAPSETRLPPAASYWERARFRCGLCGSPMVETRVFNHEEVLSDVPTMLCTKPDCPGYYPMPPPKLGGQG